jgi:tetratricopeptide (TPR) repeat protein
MLPPQQAYGKAKSAVARALEIDDSLAEAHACVGWIRTFYDWDWIGAEQEFIRALQLNPNSALAHNWYGLFLGIQGRYEECISEGRQSLELEPVSLVYNAVWSLGFYWTRSYDKAITQLKKTIEMDPTFPHTYLFMGFACTSAEMWDEAIEALTRFESLAPDNPLAMGYLGLAYGLSGRSREALGWGARLQELSQRRYVSPFYPALIYMGIDDLDRAFVSFHEAADQRDSWMTTLKTAPFMDQLRGDSRYPALLSKVGLQG